MPAAPNGRTRFRSPKTQAIGCANLLKDEAYGKASPMSGPPELRVSLSAAALANPLAHCALRFCAQAIGVRFALVDEAVDADVHYDGVDRDDESVWLPYWAESYDPAEPHVAIDRALGRIWVPLARQGRPRLT